MSGLIMFVLLCPRSGIIEPGVGQLVRQTALALSDLVDEGAKFGAHRLQVLMVLVELRVTFSPQSHSRATEAGCHS